MADLIERFKKEVEADPENWIANANLSTAYFQAGRVEEALPYCEKASRLAPDNPAILYNLGNAYRALGRYGEATEKCRAALSLKP